MRSNNENRKATIAAVIAAIHLHNASSLAAIQHANDHWGEDRTKRGGSDLKYLAEWGCIVPLHSALSTLRLKTLCCPMLANFSKMPN